ncbi:MAG: EVE domain-containing protein [Alphaproteobacteria bacterium]|nr:EVE domain-containing protein [Alphaproteobacteria bacterium]
MKKYWVGVASHDHVKNAIQSNIIQVCHGKKGPLNLMKEGDWIVYYSSKLRFGENEPYRHFTAIGQISAGEPYQFQMNAHFIPWRRNVKFHQAKDASILPLIEKLSFIHDKKYWGFPFRKGCFTVPFNDFLIIAHAMGVLMNDATFRPESMESL